MTRLLPDLPPDVSKNILQTLTSKDICNVARSCKAFWAWTCHQQSIEFIAYSGRFVVSKVESLSRYVQNRRARGLQVHNLSITFDRTRSAPLFVAFVEVIRACSKSLRRLTLHDTLYECFDPSTGFFLAAIVECKRLACLNITALSLQRNVDRDRFLQVIVSAMPQLKALQVMPITMQAHAKVFADGFVHSHDAAQSPGLQLLAMQGSKSALPASLRCLFHMNTFLRYNELDLPELELELGHFSHLEELYITDLATSQCKHLLQQGLPAVCHFLRAFILDFIDLPLVQVDAVAILDLPRLQFFALPNQQPKTITPIGTLVSALQLRCPLLTVFACKISGAMDLLCLQLLMRKGAPHLQTIQVAIEVGHSNMYGPMWRSLNGAHCLQKLHVVFRGTDIDEVDKQVKRMLKAALDVEALHLPKLATLNIYLRCIAVPSRDVVPGFVVGVPFQGAMSVAIRVRDLVAAEVMPALTQVGLHPCVKAEAFNTRMRSKPAKFYGPLPHMLSLPQVKWVAISRPGHMLEHPDWTGPDQDMLQRALAAMSRCRPLEDTLGKWDSRKPAPVHDAAINYAEIGPGPYPETDSDSDW